MKQMKMVVGITAVTLGAALYFGAWHRNVPSVPKDLRDAVADKSAIGQLGGDDQLVKRAARSQAPVSMAENLSRETPLRDVRRGDKVYASMDLILRIVDAQLDLDSNPKKRRAFAFSRGKLTLNAEDISMFADPAVGGLVRINDHGCKSDGSNAFIVEDVQAKSGVIRLLFNKSTCIVSVDLMLPSKLPFDAATFEDFDKAFGGQLRLVRTPVAQ